MNALITRIQEMLASSNTPLFFYDDDVDGLCSYLILKNHFKKGKGVLLKSKPFVGEQFVGKVDEYGADLVVVLDKSGIQQEFVDRCNVPIIWIDHHQGDRREGVIHLNPLHEGTTPYPTSYWCWLVADKKFSGFAQMGCVSDWFLIDEVTQEFEKKDLLNNQQKAPDVLFNSELGKWIKIMMFNMKGTPSQVYQSLKRIDALKSIEDIIDNQFLMDRALQIQKEYDDLFEDIQKQVTEDLLLVYTYTENKTSYTSFVSNEVLYHNMDKVIIIARHKDDEYRCSLRSGPHRPLRDALEQVLPFVKGYGGGHMHACGACIKEDDWDKFLTLLREEVEKL